MGCKKVNSNGDADLLIVQTVVELEKTKVTVMVGDDTYPVLIFIQICYYMKCTLSQRHRGP